MAYAYLSGHYTLVEVGPWFGVSYATVSRAVKAIESKMQGLTLIILLIILDPDYSIVLE